MGEGHGPARERSNNATFVDGDGGSEDGDEDVEVSHSLYRDRGSRC